VTGVLTRHPEWETTLADFQIESAWMVGAWDDVQRLADKIKIDTSSMVTARVILALRTGEQKAISDALSHARSTLGAPITAGGAKGYRRSYQAVLDLHSIHELELIYQTTGSLESGSQDSIRQGRRKAITELSNTLSARLSTTLPTFRIREPLLSMRRTAFTLS
jgi:serine/threonine-protein kinase ATR